MPVISSERLEELLEAEFLMKKTQYPIEKTNMRKPTSEEMIEGVSRAFGKFLAGYYSAPYRSLSRDVAKGISSKKLTANRKHMKKYIITTVFILLTASSACGEHRKESYYRDLWCTEQGGITEKYLDGVYCDCLTKTHAVEVDFGKKWYEAVGQSLYYSFLSGRRAGILLIIEKDKDRRYLDRLLETVKHYQLPIDVFRIGDAG